MSAKRKLVNRSDLPDHVVESIARLISPDILAFYESEEDVRKFEAWKQKQLGKGMHTA